VFIQIRLSCVRAASPPWLGNITKATVECGLRSTDLFNAVVSFVKHVRRTSVRMYSLLTIGFSTRCTQHYDTICKIQSREVTSVVHHTTSKQNTLINEFDRNEKKPGELNDSKCNQKLCVNTISWSHGWVSNLYGKKAVEEASF